jgi:hypothetical protein
MSVGERVWPACNTARVMPRAEPVAIAAPGHNRYTQGCSTPR